jgi:hypothetical protein
MNKIMKKLLLLFLYLIPAILFGQSFNNLPNAGDVTVDDSATIHRPGSYYKSALARWPFVANLNEVGEIIDDDWTDLDDWTEEGTGTFSVSGNKLTVNGGTPASITLTNYVRNSGYGNTQYMHWEAEFDIIVGTINATSWGVAFGVQSQNSFFESSPHVGIMLDNANKGNIFLFSNNSNTAITQTDRAISVSAGDTLSVKITLIYDQIEATIINNSLSPNNAITLVATQEEYSTRFRPNVGQFAIYAMGGTHTVTPVTVTCKQKKGADLLVVGDSRVSGASATNYSNSFVGLLSEIFNGTIDNYSGGGDRNQDYVAAEILALEPKKIIILSGTNNQADGDNAATTASLLKTFINSLSGYTLGSNVFYCDELPKGSADMSGYSNSYKDSLGVTGCIYTYASFRASSGTGPIVSLYATDLLHPNNLGHQKLCNVIANQLPLAKINKPKAYQIKPYFQKSKLLLGSEYTVPTDYLQIICGTLTSSEKALSLTGTMPTTIAATTNAIEINITSAGTSAFTNRAALLTYSSGYTGSATTFGLQVLNQVAGQGANILTGLSNNAIAGTSSVITTGYNIGGRYVAAGGNVSIGLAGFSINAKNSATNIGGAFFARNTGSSPIQIGVYAGLNESDPSLSSAALIADNSDQAVPVALFRDNGGVVFTIADGGNTTLTGTITHNSGIVGVTNASSASGGIVGEVSSSSTSTYTNYTTTATYQAVDSITLTAGDWDISAFFTYSSNSATITGSANAIFVISTTKASASGATEGLNIAYIPQAALVGTSRFSDSIAPYRVSIGSTTKYYLNSQATFTGGNPQYVGTIRARRLR